ncbi:MAG: hypothetical protein LBC64_08935 [Fibromonadaceae bacterium]|jgi:hypothetical protein|nr:hypothetical protein [Fibromonadaceae bacterium]
MTFVFICDTHFQKKVSSALVNGEVPNHKIITMTADQFLEAGKLPEGISGVIIERGTWQKSFSMFRYFDLLSLLEEHNLAFVSNSDNEFKGRSTMKSKEFIIHSGISADDASAKLNALEAAPPSAFVHPKSKAIA